VSGADLLVEIAAEELPPRRVREAAEALRDGLAARLAEAGLLEGWRPEGMPILGTPRRLAAWIPGVKERQADREERVWGPPVTVAFDGDGNPTKAGEGFARLVGMSLGNMGRAAKLEGKPPYLFADRVQRGRSAAEVVAAALPAVVAALPFRRSMRWPQSDLPFARPIRGLLLLLGTAVVPCRLAGCEAGRTVRGHPFLAPGPLEVPSADLEGYRTLLRGAKVVVDLDERSTAIRGQVEKARAAACGVAAPWSEEDAALLPEVAGLVEWPRTLLGSFEARYLDLPPALLVTAMAHHLRYFPVLDAGGMVRNRFASVTDREEAHADGIRGGNERVLRARLYDAAFFFAADRRRPLAEFRPALAGVDFHRGLGTLLDKSERVRRIAVSYCDTLKISPDGRARADRAAFLLKCDLLTEVVKEFPELQGQIGAHYAGLDGEEASVAAAVAGQYLPRGEWDPVLDDRIAAVVSLAEKADTLAAYFSIGEEPTGSADPYGLRRQAQGILQILSRKEWPLSIEGVLLPASSEWKLPAEAVVGLHAFVWARADQTARSQGFTDFVDAVGVLTHRPFHEYRARLQALQSLSRSPEWKGLVALVERTGNMGEAAPAPPAGTVLPAEGTGVAIALDRARGVASAEPDPLAFARKYLELLGAPVAALFEKVLVDDPAQPERRVALKHVLHGVFSVFADRLGDLRKLGAGARR
jgi:glycyl-tRNA synthetase beta chain